MEDVSFSQNILLNVTIHGFTDIRQNPLAGIAR